LPRSDKKQKTFGLSFAQKPKVFFFEKENRTAAFLPATIRYGYAATVSL